MPSFAQEQITRVMENFGGAFSGLKRYVDAAELIGSTSYFAFVKRDEFDMFPDAAAQLDKVKSLLRGVAYSAADEILRLEITDVTPGVTYNLVIVDAFGGDTLASVTGGVYGAESDLDSEQSVTHAPGGKIVVEAPTGNPSALVSQQVEIRMVPSAVRLSQDVTGETTNEGLLEAAALESHQITASNLKAALLEAARNRVVLDRLLRKLVGEFINSSTEFAFEENQQQLSDGAVINAPSGLLPEMDFVFKTNVPAQTVDEIVATLTTSKFDSDKATEAGTLTITERQPTAGTLRLRCTRGFDVEIDDPEEFEVTFLSTTLDRDVKSAFRARPFRSFDWLRGGFEFTINRKTEADDPLNRMANPVIKNATPTRIPLQRLEVQTRIDLSSSLNSFFKIVDPKTGTVLFQVFTAPGTNPLPNGSQDLLLFNGLNVTFDWTNNPTADGPISFDITIHPFRAGDTFERTYSISGGRLNVELRRQFDFAFSAARSSPAPTIPDSVVTPDLPFVDLFLGA